MKTADRLDRIEAALDKLTEANASTSQLTSQTAANLDKLSQVTATLAASVAAHERIERLVEIAEIQQQRWEQLQREWQAYLTTIHPRQ